MRVLSRRLFMQVAAAVFAATQVAASGESAPADPTQLSVRVYPYHVMMRMRTDPTGPPIDWRVGDKVPNPCIRCRDDQLDVPQFEVVTTQMADGTVHTYDRRHDRSNGASLSVIRFINLDDVRCGYYGVTLGSRDPAWLGQSPLVWEVTDVATHEVSLRCLLPPSHREPIAFEWIRAAGR